MLRCAPILLLAAAACQEPFGVARQDLVGDRVAALTVRDGTDGSVQASSALVVDGHLWSDTPVTLDWFQVASLDDAADRDVPDPVASGPVVSIPRNAEAPVLALRATFPSGAEEWAAIELADALDDPPDASGLTLSAQQTTADDVVALTLDAPVRARFMTVGGRGTVRESTVSTADLIIAEVVYDDGEEESRSATEDGVLQVMGLAIGNGNDWVVKDAWVGPVPTGAWLSSGQFLISDRPLLAGTFEAQLTADDDAPWGLRIAATRDLTDAPALDLMSLVDGTSLRSDLDGHWVQVTVP